MGAFGSCDSGRHGALCARSTADVDECEAGLDDCDEHAVCFHPVRSYNCTCQSGYTGYGRMVARELTDLRDPAVIVRFRASFNASVLQLSRLSSSSDSLTLDEWLDRPHALLQDSTRPLDERLYVDEDKVYVEADVGRITPLKQIVVWMFHRDGRAHRRVRVEASISGAFEGEQVLLYKCGDYDDCGGAEPRDGRRFDVGGIAARFVRVYIGRNTLDLTVRFLRISIISSNTRGCAPCPLGSTFDSAVAGECRACTLADDEGDRKALKRVEGALVGCGLLSSCDDGAGRSFMGSCFRYFGPSVFERGEVPASKAGDAPRRQDGAVSFRTAQEECENWGGTLAVLTDRARMQVVQGLLKEAAWVGVHANASMWALNTSHNSSLPLTWLDGSPVVEWGGAETWGADCLGGSRSGDCPPPRAGEDVCVVMGLGGFLRKTRCSGAGEADDAKERGVVRSWVCEKRGQSGQGSNVQVQLSVRSSSGQVGSLDPTSMRIASSCGDACQCDALSGCICGESGAVLGEIVGAPEASGGLLLLTVSVWLFAGLDCFITVEDSRGSSFADFESVVLEVPAAQVSQYAASGQPVPLRMMAVEPVNPLQTKGVRAVLSWGESPSDLDFHIYKDMGGEKTCLACGEGEAAARVCSQAQPVDFRRKMGFNGVSLDLDDTTSYGPETITWDDAADEGEGVPAASLRSAVVACLNSTLAPSLGGSLRWLLAPSRRGLPSGRARLQSTGESEGKRGTGAGSLEKRPRDNPARQRGVGVQL